MTAAGDLVVAIHTVSTLFMTGVIWYVQLAHYPLFATIPASDFPAYEAQHTQRTSWVVMLPMIVEALTAIALVAMPPRGIPPAVVGVGLAGVVVIWLSTALLQVPCHRRLAHGFSPAVHRRLVGTNWIRTVTWSLRSVLAIWIALAI